MSGSGKASALKAFEDLGYYCVDNLPVELIPRFAELAVQSSEIARTALVVDVREGSSWIACPASEVGQENAADQRDLSSRPTDAALLRRFSETRRPHPFGKDEPVRASLAAERKDLRPIRAIADLVIDTSKFNVHELRAHVTDRFQQQDYREEHPGLMRELRVQARRAGRFRPDVRRALSAQPAFRSGIPRAHRTRSASRASIFGHSRKPGNSSAASRNCWSTCFLITFTKEKVT